MFGNSRVFAIGLLLTNKLVHGYTIGYAGDSMSQDPAFIAKLQTTGFSFRHVSNFGASELSGLNALWLDGFSIFDPEFNGYDLTSPALNTFVSANHLLIVQSPGFGGNNLGEYPFAAGLSLQPTASEASVRIQQVNPYLTAVTSAQLSNWQDDSSPAYFDGITGFTGLADNGTNGQWITIAKTIGAGATIYTFQDISRNIGTPKEADALALLRSFVVPEPSTNALLVSGTGLLVWNVRRRFTARR
jgi:hypothetical protein